MNEKPTETPSLASLDAQLETLKKSQPQPVLQAPKDDASRAAIDFASASAVGSALGFGVDYLAHTSPWGLVVGLMLGVAAGFRMMLRATTPKPAPTQEQK